MLLQVRRHVVSAAVAHLDGMTETHERTLNEMANVYSRRAREARIRQGKPAVLNQPVVLTLLAELIAADDDQGLHPPAA